MTVTFCTSGAVKAKAGANRPTDDTVVTDTMYTQYINEAENYLNDLVSPPGVDLLTAFSGLSSNKKLLLEDAAACRAAIEVIRYDMSGYTSRNEAGLMINTLWAQFKDCVDLLTNKNKTDFMRGV